MADLRLPNLSPPDARVAGFVFEFVQFLLDDDANLTPAGNLTGAARQRLRARLDELTADEEAPTPAGSPADLALDPADILGPAAADPGGQP